MLGGVFTWYAVRLLRMSERRSDLAISGSAGELAVRATAMRIFTWSITYITLLFGAMALDQLLRTGRDRALQQVRRRPAYVTRFPNRTRPFPQDPR